MKSISVAVALPAWTWTIQPDKRFLFASYALSLSIRDSLKCRRLIDSPWYQSHFGDQFKLTTDQNQKQRFENDKTGYRIATSVDGALTGEGGDIIVIDDPHNVREAESSIVREGVLEWWDQAMQTRLNDPKTGSFIIIMQRVHENDLTGHVLANEHDDWDHLCLPARYEQDHPYQTKSSLGFKDIRTQENELLWPDRIDDKTLQSLERSLGVYASAGQLQQRPMPKGGGILREEWWQPWDKKNLPNVEYVLQSYDTAFSTKEKTSYSDYEPDAVLIEKKASGQSLLQDLRMAGIPVLEYLPDRDKEARAHASSALLEDGRIWYPADRNWAKDLISICAAFPAGDNDDIVDTCTQAWLRLRKSWSVSHSTDYEEDDIIPQDRVTMYG